MDGAADDGPTTYTPFRLSPAPNRCGSSSRRVKPTAGVRQLALFATYSWSRLHSPTGTARPWNWRPTTACHAEIENAIRDLKYGVGLNHMPSGRFAANGAWLAVQIDPMAENNLARLDGADRSGRADATTGKTLRRRLLLPGRTAHPLGTPPHPASCHSAGLGKPTFSRAQARLRSDSTPSRV